VGEQDIQFGFGQHGIVLRDRMRRLSCRDRASLQR
jgi:hypothetical protein